MEQKDSHILVPSQNCTSENDCRSQNDSLWFQKVSLTQWFNTTCDDNHSDDTIKKRALPLIDIRSPTDHLKCPINNTNDNPIVVHLPWETLLDGERSCELPPRNKRFAILTSPSQPLDDEIYNFFMATESKATGKSRQPWKVQQVIIDQVRFRDEALALGITCDHRTRLESSSVCLPLPRLWGPDRLVQHCILPQLKRTLAPSDKNNQRSKYVEIWDLGCGSGRDICFLAEEMKHFVITQTSQQCIPQGNTDNNISVPLKFIGIDNHKGSAKRCIPLWKYRRVQDITETTLFDLNKLEVVQNFLKQYHVRTSNHDNIESVLVIYAIRFLNRKLVNYLIHSSMIESGTIFAMSHFCKQDDDSPWNFEHPKENYVLKRNELKEMFNINGKWEVLVDTICSDGDHGRTLIQFMAERI